MTARFQSLLWLLLTSRIMAGPPQVRASSFPQSLPHLLDKHTPLRAFGSYNDVLAYPTYQASYAIPVRQYRVLPVGFLQCIPHGKPPCHLLTVRGVTPVRKGLTPSGNISCSTYVHCNEKFVFFEFIQSFHKSVHMLMLGTHKKYIPVPRKINPQPKHRYIFLTLCGILNNSTKQTYST